MEPYESDSGHGNQINGHKYRHKGYNFGFGSSYGPAGSTRTRKVVNKTISGYKEAIHGPEPIQHDRRPSFRGYADYDYEPVNYAYKPHAAYNHIG